MSEPFKVPIILTGEDARKFKEYDADPMKYETERSRKAAKRAQKISETIIL